MSKSGKSFAALAALALLAVAAAAGAQARPAATVTAAGPAAGAGGSPTVRVGALAFAQYAPTYYVGRVARRYGVNVEVKSFTRAVDAVEALRAGAIDVTFGGIGSFLPSYAGGVQMYLVGALGSGGYRLLRRPDVQVSGYPELRGKKIGLTRGALEVLWAAVLEKGGLTARDVSFIFLPGTADMNQALQRKNVDVIIQSEPPASQAVEDGYGIEVRKPYDTTLGPISKVVMMSKKLYDDRRTAQSFMNALVYSINYLEAHKSVKSQFTREHIFRGLLSEKDYQSSVLNAPGGFDLTVQEVQATADLMFASGQLRERVDARQAVKLDLLAQAKKVVGVTIPGTTGVTITVTPTGKRCMPSPRTVPAGHTVFRLVNQARNAYGLRVAGKTSSVARPKKDTLLRVTFSKPGTYPVTCTSKKGGDRKGVLVVKTA